MSRQASHRRPVLFHGVVAGVIALALAAGLWFALGQRADLAPVIGCWLLAVNGVAFAYYGFDKRQAAVAGRRVPEVVLHGLTALGGSAGSYAGMRYFRHKTIKSAFRILFWCIVALQLALAVWIVKLTWWP